MGRARRQEHEHREAFSYLGDRTVGEVRAGVRSGHDVTRFHEFESEFVGIAVIQPASQHDCVFHVLEPVRQPLRLVILSEQLRDQFRNSTEGSLGLRRP